MDTNEKYRLQQSLGYQLSVASRLQERRLDDGLKDLGLTRITWCVLLAVANENLVHPSEIADFVRIDRTATSRALRQMEMAGMIERSSGVGDRRMTSVFLTELGKDLVVKGSPLARANNQILERRLNDEERVELRRLLEKMSSGESVALSRL